MSHHLSRASKATLRFRLTIVVLVIAGALMLWRAVGANHHEAEPKGAPAVPPGEAPPPSRL